MQASFLQLRLVTAMKLIHLPTPVRYLSRAEGGVSHFNYWRDNLLLIGMHLRLGYAALRRWWINART